LYLTMMTLEFGIAQLYSIIENTSRYSRAGKKNDINMAETTKNREIHQRCLNCQFQRCDLTPVLSRTEPDLWGTCFTTSWRACSMIAAMYISWGISPIKTVGFTWLYPLVNSHITMENHHV
jgi:hypothetical protein